MPITRKPDWQSLLHHFIEGRKKQPFAWGTNDCALFAADAIHSFTGTDLGAGIRGTYTTEADAGNKMTSICGSADALALATHFAAASGYIAWSHVNFAQRGDLVVLANPDGSHSVGIVSLNGVHALFVTTSGLRRMRTRDCVAAWKVS